MPRLGRPSRFPIHNGGELFVRALAALSRQTVEHELLVCDSGSTDGSVAAARAHGARVLEIPNAQFSHGGTRNLLMARVARRARGHAQPGRRARE